MAYLTAEDEVSIVFRNVRNYIPKNTTLHKDFNRRFRALLNLRMNYGTIFMEWIFRIMSRFLCINGFGYA
jgi:hypothetical protein